MPLRREAISISVLGEELGFDPKRFVGIECDRRSGPVVIVLEEDVAQTSSVIPQLNTGGKRVGGKKSKGRK